MWSCLCLTGCIPQWFGPALLAIIWDNSSLSLIVTNPQKFIYPHSQVYGNLGGRMSPNLVKSRSVEIGCYDDHFAQKFDRHLDSAASQISERLQTCKPLSRRCFMSRSPDLLQRRGAFWITVMYMCVFSLWYCAATPHHVTATHDSLDLDQGGDRGGGVITFWNNLNKPNRKSNRWTTNQSITDW